MSDLLQFIKEKNSTSSLIIGKIFEKVEDRYYIKDKKNRVHVVSSFSTYSVGITVIARNGFILGSVSDYKSIPSFVV